MCKEKILTDICDWFEYDLVIGEDGKISMFSYYGHKFDLFYDDMDSALIGWLSTLIGSDEYTNRYEIEDNRVWEKEIKFIENLQK